MILTVVLEVFMQANLRTVPILLYEELQFDCKKFLLMNINNVK